MACLDISMSSTSMRLEGPSDHPDMEVDLNIRVLPSDSWFHRSGEARLELFMDPGYRMAVASRLLSGIPRLHGGALRISALAVEGRIRRAVEGANPVGLQRIIAQIETGLYMVSPPEEDEEDPGLEEETPHGFRIISYTDTWDGFGMVPAARPAIEALEKEVVVIEEIAAVVDDCAVCMEEYMSGQTLAVMPCSHIGTISGASRCGSGSANGCPTCRRTI